MKRFSLIILAIAGFILLLFFMRGNPAVIQGGGIGGVSTPAVQMPGIYQPRPGGGNQIVMPGSGRGCDPCCRNEGRGPDLYYWFLTPPPMISAAQVQMVQ